MFHRQGLHALTFSKRMFKTFRRNAGPLDCCTLNLVKSTPVKARNFVDVYILDPVSTIMVVRFAVYLHNTPATMSMRVPSDH